LRFSRIVYVRERKFAGGVHASSGEEEKADFSFGDEEVLGAMRRSK
jgi:hypothetical protein